MLYSLRAGVSQCPPEMLQQPTFIVRGRGTRRTALPHSHSPNRIEAASSDGIPSADDTELRSTGFSALLLSSESQTHVLISYNVG